MKLFLGGTEDEEKRMTVKLKLSSSQKLPPFVHISKKSTHSFFSAWSFLLILIQFAPSAGPKDFVNLDFLGNWTVRVGPTSLTMGKKTIFHCPDFMVQGVNLALSLTPTSCDQVAILCVWVSGIRPPPCTGSFCSGSSEKNNKFLKLKSCTPK
jgi:hypothetical protein